MGSVCVLFSPRFGELRQILQLRLHVFDRFSDWTAMSLHAHTFCIGLGTSARMAGRHLSTLEGAHGKIHGRQHPLLDLMGPSGTI